MTRALRLRRRSLLSLGILLISCSMSHSQQSAMALLDHLSGSWVMTGTLMKKPVRYEAEGTWVLQHQFLSLHMLDAANPPQYEADILIGIDTAKKQYVAHWLDSFGGVGSRVVATGPLSAQQIEVIYPYEEGKFRNLFTYTARQDAWTLLIESENPDGTWSVFAQYSIIRK